MAAGVTGALEELVADQTVEIGDVTVEVVLPLEGGAAIWAGMVTRRLLSLVGQHVLFQQFVLQKLFPANPALKLLPRFLVGGVGRQAVVAITGQGEALAAVLTGVAAPPVNVGDVLVQVGLGLECLVTIGTSGMQIEGINEDNVGHITEFPEK